MAREPLSAVLDQLCLVLYYVLCSHCYCWFVDIHVHTAVGGGLNYVVEVHSSLLCPPLIFFLKVSRKKGGVTAWQYGSSGSKLLKRNLYL